MKSLAGYRDAGLIRLVADQINALHLTRTVRLMEVCGGHTAAIYRFALHDILPDKVKLLSGPGCPVCVTPNSFIDRAIALAEQHGATIATFGDLLRVPGSYQTLADVRAAGCDVRVFYSSADALEYASETPQATVVFLGIGFETTACTIAATMASAVDRDIKNFKLLCSLKTMPEALRALLTSPDVQIDGLILPGHVTTIAGTGTFEFISKELGLASAVAGFEPLDLMEAIGALCKQIYSGSADTENHYTRVVRSAGNPQAQAVMQRMFVGVDTEWRGLGYIMKSGLALRDEYSQWDAGQFEVEVPATRENKACRCGEVLRGVVHPLQCPLFGDICTPEQPQGACMVSAEGACAAVYHFHPVANHE